MSAYIARINDRAYQAMCTECTWFRRVAWTRPKTPRESCIEHNANIHGITTEPEIRERPSLVPMALLP